MAKSRKYELGVGCLLIAAVAVLAFMAIQIGAFGSLRKEIELTARFDDAVGLNKGAEVAIAGVEIGTVKSLRIDHNQAVATISIDAKANVRKDALVRLRSRSVLGERYDEEICRVLIYRQIDFNFYGTCGCAGM